MVREEFEGVEDPRSIVDRRLARGEIDASEHEAIRRAMAPGGSSRGGGRLPTSSIVILIVLGVVVAFAFTALAMTGPSWGMPGGSEGGWPWEGCCTFGGPGMPGMGGMGGGPMQGAWMDVSIAGYAYSPQELTVAAGATVTWVNMDHVAHTVSFGAHGEDHEGEGAESGSLSHMEAWSTTFLEPGTFEYHCDPHPYMTGVVIVEA